MIDGVSIRVRQPVYVFYDESKEFYQELSEVQAEILADDETDETDETDEASRSRFCLDVSTWRPLGSSRKISAGLMAAAALAAVAVVLKSRRA